MSGKIGYFLLTIPAGVVEYFREGTKGYSRGRSIIGDAGRFAWNSRPIRAYKLLDVIPEVLDRA